MNRIKVGTHHGGTTSELRNRRKRKGILDTLWRGPQILRDSQEKENSVESHLVNPDLDLFLYPRLCMEGDSQAGEFEHGNVVSAITHGNHLYTDTQTTDGSGAKIIFGPRIDYD